MVFRVESVIPCCVAIWSSNMKLAENHTFAHIEQAINNMVGVCEALYESADLLEVESQDKSRPQKSVGKWFSHLEDKRLGRNKCLQMDCSASALIEPSLTHQFAKMHTFCRLSEIYTIQSATSIHRQDVGAYCKAAVGGKCMASKAKLSCHPKHSYDLKISTNWYLK